MGLLQLLAENKDKSWTVLELAEKTGYHDSLICTLPRSMSDRNEADELGRVMRMMSAIAFVDEVGYQTYTANANTLTQCLPGNLGGTILTWVFLRVFNCPPRKLAD